MKNLLTVTAVIEGGTSLVMVALPSVLVKFLFGSSLSTPVELNVARVSGVAILASVVACWLARHKRQSCAARGVVGAMVLYNAGIAMVLVHAGIGLSGIGL